MIPLENRSHGGSLDFYNSGFDAEAAETDGAIGSGPRQRSRPTSTFHPRKSNDIQRSLSDSNLDFTDYENEPPLMEELGINFGHIWQKTMYVLIPRKNLQTEILQDGDLAGPMLFVLALGFALLCAGKVHFGYIYGFSVIGCFGIYVILNLMCDDNASLDMLHTVSIMGYCVLPILFLSVINIVFNLQGYTGLCLSIFFVGWAAWISTRFFEKLTHMSHQKWLILYPMALFYSCFALITVF